MTTHRGGWIGRRGGTDSIIDAMSNDTPRRVGEFESEGLRLCEECDDVAWMETRLIDKFHPALKTIAASEGTCVIAEVRDTENRGMLPVVRHLSSIGRNLIYPTFVVVLLGFVG